MPPEIPPFPRRRLVFCGPSDAGKDEAALFLCRTYAGLTYGQSISWHIAPELAPLLGVPIEVLRGPDRHQYAVDFFAFGEEVRSHDPGHFLSRALTAGNVVTGVRDPREVDWGRAMGMVDLFVWVDRPVPPDPTMRLFGADHCDITIRNHGTRAGLHAALARWADFSGFLRLDRGTPDG